MWGGARVLKMGCWFAGFFFDEVRGDWSYAYKLPLNTKTNPGIKPPPPPQKYSIFTRVVIMGREREKGIHCGYWLARFLRIEVGGGRGGRFYSFWWGRVLCFWGITLK